MSSRSAVFIAIFFASLPLTADVASEQWSAAMKGVEIAAANDKQDDEVDRLRAALKIAEPFGETDVRLLDTLSRLASACLDLDNDSKCTREEGKRFLDRALGLRAKVKTRDAHLADILMRIGRAASGDSRYREAQLCYGEALEIREKEFGSESEMVAKTYVELAWVYEAKDDHKQARDTFQHALELRRKAGADGTAEFADLLDEFATLYRSQDDDRAAEQQNSLAIAIREKLWKQTDPRFIAALRKTAKATGYRKNSEYAEKIHLRLTEITKGAGTKGAGEYYQSLIDHADFYTHKKRFKDAEATYREALSSQDKLGRRGLTASDCLESIARTQEARGLHKESAATAEEAATIRDQLLANTGVQVLRLYSFLSETYAEMGDTRTAEARFATFLGPARLKQPYMLVSTAERLGDLYQQRGNYAMAAEKLEIAAATYEALAGANSPALAPKILRLGRIYEAMGRTNEANAMVMRALQIQWTEAQQSAKGALSPRNILIGALGLLAANLIFGMVLAFVYHRLSKRLQRKVDALYVPPAPLAVAAVAPDFQPVFAPSEVCLEGTQLTMEAKTAEAAVAVTEAVAVEETPAPPPSFPAVRRVILHADGGTLLAIRVLNLLLSLMTLGIYSFWGKAKVRRYLCGQAECDDDRFAFHGTGKELLLGWFRGLPILGFILFMPRIVPLVWQTPKSLLLAQVGVLAAIAVLWPVARAGAYRYRLNRMSWRGIRFSFRGRTLSYVWLNLRGFALSVVTLGIYAPAFQIRARRFLFDQTYFGNRCFAQTGSARDLLPNYIFAMPLTFMTLGLFWPWWSALRHRYYWAHTTFGGARFRCDITGGALLWLWITNALLLVPTLGLAMPWVTLRTLRFWTDRIRLVGEPEFTTVWQDARATSAMGESFADFLGFDFGF